MISELFSSIVVSCGSRLIMSVDKYVAKYPSELCTLQDCPQSKSDSSFSNRIVTCPEGALDIEIKQDKQFEDARCKWRNDVASGVTQISLIPVQNLNLLLSPSSEAKIWSIFFAIMPPQT